MQNEDFGASSTTVGFHRPRKVFDVHSLGTNLLSSFSNYDTTLQDENTQPEKNVANEKPKNRSRPLQKKDKWKYC